MKKLIKISVVGILILVLGVLAITYLTTLKNTTASFSDYLKNKDNANDVDIVKTVESQNEIFLIYRGEDNKVAMAYFEPSKILTGRYVYSGGAKSSLPFNSYNLGTPQETLVVLYGDNTKIHADTVSFTNGDITYLEQIASKDYVLSIYRLEKGESISSENITLLDTDGAEIQLERHKNN